ncbi:unnamed protein product, partial [Polarella glacialis]
VHAAVFLVPTALLAILGLFAVDVITWQYEAEALKIPPALEVGGHTNNNNDNNNDKDTLVGAGEWSKNANLVSASSPPPPVDPCQGQGIVSTLLVPGLRASSACRTKAMHHAPLFVSVTSPVGNFKLRKARRKKWLKTPNFPSVDRASYAFVVGKSDDMEVQRKIVAEMEEFGDVIQLDSLDTFPNLAVKSVAAAAWVAVMLDLSKVQYWLKVEDYMANSFKDIDELVKKLSKQAEVQPWYGGGMIFGDAEVLRDGRWGCAKR